MPSSSSLLLNLHVSTAVFLALAPLELEQESVCKMETYCSAGFAPLLSVIQSPN